MTAPGGDSPALHVQRAAGKLAEAWREQEAPIAQSLRPGLSDLEMDAEERRAGLVFPETLRALFAWRDGADGGIDERNTGISSWQFAPLSVLVDYHLEPWQRFRELSAETSGTDLAQVWPNQFPVFLFPHSVAEQIVTATSSHRDGVHTVWTPTVDTHPDYTPQHHSLVSLLETWAWWMEGGYIRRDRATGRWDRSDQLHWSTYRSGFC